MPTHNASNPRFAISHAKERDFVKSLDPIGVHSPGIWHHSGLLMKPTKYALLWSLFLGTLIMTFIVTHDHLYKTHFWEILDSYFSLNTEEHNHSFSYLVITLLMALTLNNFLMTSTLALHRKITITQRKTSTTFRISPNGAPSKKGRTFSPETFTALWLLYFVSYVIFFIIIFMLYPEQWLWELILDNYDFVGDPLWDSLYEGFIALVALLANVSFICLTLSAAKKAFFNSDIS